MGVREATLVTDHATMDYISFGKGTQPLVLIPGLTLKDVKGSGRGLAYMYRIFSADYAVYCIDKRWDIPADYSVCAIADDYAAAMKKLGIENACVLGVSQGGMIAQYLALNHPELVGKLVLGVTLSRNNDTVVSCVDHWVELASAGRFEELARDTFEKCYSDAYLKKCKFILPLLAKMAKPKNPDRFVALAKACLTCDTYDRLDEIQCPVLVIGGWKDRIVTGEASLEIAEMLSCEVYMYPDLGHAAYEEAKDFNKRVFEFFGK